MDFELVNQRTNERCDGTVLQALKERKEMEKKESENVLQGVVETALDYKVFYWQHDTRNSYDYITRYAGFVLFFIFLKELSFFFFIPLLRWSGYAGFLLGLFLKWRLFFFTSEPEKGLLKKKKGVDPLHLPEEHPNFV